MQTCLLGEGSGIQYQYFESSQKVSDHKEENVGQLRDSRGFAQSGYHASAILKREKIRLKSVDYIDMLYVHY